MKQITNSSMELGKPARKVLRDPPRWIYQLPPRCLFFLFHFFLPPPPPPMGIIMNGMPFIMNTFGIPPPPKFMPFILPKPPPPPLLKRFLGQPHFLVANSSSLKASPPILVTTPAPYESLSFLSLDLYRVNSTAWSSLRLGAMSEVCLMSSRAR